MFVVGMTSILSETSNSLTPVLLIFLHVPLHNVRIKSNKFIHRKNFKLNVQLLCLVSVYDKLLYHPRVVSIPYYYQFGNSIKIQDRVKINMIFINYLYLQTMKGTPAKRIAPLRPNLSMIIPPINPPKSAESGIKLPIHDP